MINKEVQKVVVKKLLTLSAVITAIGVLTGAWVEVHSQYLTKDDHNVQSIIDKVDYYDTRFKESKDTERKAIMKAKKDTYCDTLKQLEEPNEWCE